MNEGAYDKTADLDQKKKWLISAKNDETDFPFSVLFFVV